MFLRRRKRQKNGTDYEYWTLVESIRTEHGPRQRIVGTIGKISDLKEEEATGWDEISRILSGKSPKAKDLFEIQPAIPDWAVVNMRQVSIERIRRFDRRLLGTGALEAAQTRRDVRQA